MMKCKNCGREFEGNFCPYCGAEYGKALEKSTAGVHGVKSTISTVYSALNFVPALFFALFAVLMFAFFAAPVAVMGGDELSVNLGNAYALNNEALSEITGLQSVLATSILIASFAVIFAVFAVIFTLSRYHRTVATFKGMTMSRIFSIGGSAIIYLSAFIAGLLTTIRISAYDEGAGFFKAGACPVLIIVFSVLFAIFTVAALAARHIIAVKYPDCKKSDEEYLALVDEYLNGLSAPEKPKIPEKFMLKMQNLGSVEDIRAKLRAKGKRMVISAFVVAGIGFLICVFHLLSMYYLPIYNYLPIYRNLTAQECFYLTIFLASIFWVVAIVLLRLKRSRYFFSEVKYARRVKLFKKGKNYSGSKGFNAWLLSKKK